MAAITASAGYRFGDFELQPRERRLLRGGEALRVAPHAFDLLVTLVERSGHLVTKDELFERVWGKVIVEENTLQAHISALRKVLGPQAIVTVPGHGYRWALEVTRLAAKVATATARKDNLPYALTSFIGREDAIATLVQLLGTTRLLTLTGSGGCGKTRLAIQLAKRQAHAYPDGVWLVELAALTDSALLPQVLAGVLAIKEQAGMRLLDVITAHLASRSVLLVLDNAEHLVEGCAELAESLLQRCARLVILVTSRERLGVTGELIYRVPSLSVPDEAGDTTPESIAAYEAARLFIDRARLQQPQFVCTAQNAAALASICRRLDGIALALELAAPCVRSLSVEELSRGLDRRFDFLTEGSRTALPRHRTLRALINWSYDLLHEAEKWMLRSVSVFAGGWTLEAAEQLFGSDLSDRSSALDLLTSLADKNLITADTHEGATRYAMLETVREYAREQLRETGAQAQSQDRHLAFFLKLAEEAYHQKSETSAPTWLDRLDTERDNFRCALSWSIATRSGDAAVRLAGALAWFWVVRGDIVEGRHWLSGALAVADPNSSLAVRTYALRAASLLAQRHADHAEARRLAEEGLALYLKSADRHGLALSWQSVGLVAQSQADFAAARKCHEEALALFRELDDKVGTSVVLCCLGQMANDEGRYQEASARLEESVALARATGDWRLTHSLVNLGEAVRCQGNHERARALLEEALARSRTIGDTDVMGYALVTLARLTLDGSDHDHTHSLLREVLAIERKIRNPQTVADALDLFGQVALALGVPLAAVRAWGQAWHLREECGLLVKSPRSSSHAGSVAATRAALGEDAFQVAWNEGRAMTLDEAIDSALTIGRVH